MPVVLVYHTGWVVYHTGWVLYLLWKQVVWVGNGKSMISARA